MATVEFLSGNDAAAMGMKQINPHVVCAYPITPSTPIVESFASFVANGEVETEFMTPESEHAAMSACIGAAAAGGRVMTATASNGLALMHEMLFIASGMRLPIVAAIANRALSAPLNIHADHGDTLASRDCGWVQLFSKNCQEVYDNMLQAVRISEHMDVRLPVMVCFDGFNLSHSIEDVLLEEQDKVEAFVGEYERVNALLDFDDVVTHGLFDDTDWYFEHRRQVEIAQRAALPVVAEIGKEFGETFGREYGLVWPYRLEDAETAIVSQGVCTGTIEQVVDELRDAGRKVGCLQLRCFRPFPNEQLVEHLRHVKAIGVAERCSPQGTEGAPIYTELRSALYDEPERPRTANFIYGLGGRDLPQSEVVRAFDLLDEVAAGEGEGALKWHLNLRE
jgi:pyruvate ferredoxin oxidoreductase alpha subunit